MAVPTHNFNYQRSFGRRKEDWLVRNYLQQFKQLFNISLKFTSEINMKQLFEVIINETNHIMRTERSSVFLYDKKAASLWSFFPAGRIKGKISIKADSGVEGLVFQNRSPVIINNAYEDSRFADTLDHQTGFKTRNLLCIPLIDGEGACIGVLEALNKRVEDFTEEDVELLTLVSFHVIIAIRNSKIYEDLKATNKARERIISHLSHELKTPLAVISHVFEILSKEEIDTNREKIEKVLQRGQRNLNRLLRIHENIQDILHKDYDEEKVKFLDFIEDTISIIEDVKEENRRSELKLLLDSFSERIESIFPMQDISLEKISLREFLEDICNVSVSAIKKRELKLTRRFDDDFYVIIDKNALKKTCMGLLKNAIENTPDEGRIEVILKYLDDQARVSFHDYGVGITSQNQKLIFGGFFHTQDSELYSSKNPYEFNAGGAGSDLLRIKVFSERFGFRVDFESKRCKFIPDDTDICPGRISSCKHIARESECLASGGSIFTLVFPKAFPKR